MFIVPVFLSVIWNWRKQTVLLDTSVSPGQSSGSVIDLFNAHFIAGNPPPRIFHRADRVVMGNLLAEKGENYHSEMIQGRSGSVSLSPYNLSGWAEIVDWISSPLKDFIMIGARNKKEGQVGIFVTKHKVRWLATGPVTLGLYSQWLLILCSHTYRHFLLQPGLTQRGIKVWHYSVCLLYFIGRMSSCAVNAALKEVFFFSASDSARSFDHGYNLMITAVSRRSRDKRSEGSSNQKGYSAVLGRGWPHYGFAH